jgi:chorismate synthase
MGPNSIGTRYVLTVFGESHGRCVGVVLDGVPAGFNIDTERIDADMARRRPGQSEVTTARSEEDKVEILSGTFKGKTTGAPVTLVTWNKDADSSVYERFKSIPRPGHADYTAAIRYGGFNDYRGSGRFSGRITAAIVMAGSIAVQIVEQVLPAITLGAHARQIASVRYDGPVSLVDLRDRIEANPVRCYDATIADQMIEAIEQARMENDSVGGIVECIIDGMPAGVGIPLFDNLESQFARMMFAIGAVKGIEFGAGFNVAGMRGSEDNDPFEFAPDGSVRILSNHAGGILGGISTGAPIVFRVAIKPTSSIAKAQQSIDMATGENVTLEYEGRHDPCIVPRAVPVIEAAAAAVLLDVLLDAGIVPPVRKEVRP